MHLTRHRALSGSLILVMSLLLAACSSTKTGTALQLIQQQEEKQSMIRQHEAEAAKKSTPTEAQLLLSLIHRTQDEGRHFAALAYINAYIKEFGHNAELDAAHAQALRQTGQLEKSEVAYQSILSSPLAPQGWHGLGLLAAQRGDYRQAIPHLSKAAALDPTNAEFLSDLGFAQLQAGQFEQARLPLGQAAELAPGNAKVLGNLAILLILENKPQQAEHVIKAANLSPDARQQVYQLGMRLRSAQRPSEAPTVTQNTLPNDYDHRPLVR